MSTRPKNKLKRLSTRAIYRFRSFKHSLTLSHSHLHSQTQSLRPLVKDVGQVEVMCTALLVNVCVCPIGKESAEQLVCALLSDGTQRNFAYVSLSKTCKSYTWTNDLYAHDSPRSAAILIHIFCLRFAELKSGAERRLRASSIKSLTHWRLLVF